MLRLLATAVILAHAAASIWHGEAHAGAGVATGPLKDIFIWTFVVTAPLGAGLLLWTGRFRAGYLVLAIAMSFAFLFGAINHYLLDTHDVVWNLEPGDWQAHFRVSAFALLVTESFGAALALLGLGDNRGIDNAA